MARHVLSHRRVFQAMTCSNAYDYIRSVDSTGLSTFFEASYGRCAGRLDKYPFFRGQISLGSQNLPVGHCFRGPTGIVDGREHLGPVDRRPNSYCRSDCSRIGDGLNLVLFSFDGLCDGRRIFGLDPDHSRPRLRDSQRLEFGEALPDRADIPAVADWEYHRVRRSSIQLITHLES